MFSMADDIKPKANQVQIRVNPEQQTGVYSNLVSITIADNEVVLDFAMSMPNTSAADVVSRVIMSPQVAKNFMSAFQNAILDFDIAREKRKKDA